MTGDPGADLNYGLDAKLASYGLVASVAFIFLMSLTFMSLFFVVPTFRASTDQKKRWWKVFWNHVEMLWLITAFAGIVSALLPIWSLTNQLITDSYIPELARDDAQINQWTGDLITARCDPTKRPDYVDICDYVQKSKDEKIDTGQSALRRYHELSEIGSKHHFSDANDAGAFSNFVQLFSIKSQHLRHKEASMAYSPFFVEYSLQKATWWPFVLAFALGLKFAKTLAGYVL